jgi:hemerythrin-like domain-containing protein
MEVIENISRNHFLFLFLMSNLVMQENKPIKRSIQLAPLSREHHDGLLLAWKIRQGIAKRSSLEPIRNYVLWYWRHHIKPHFFQEEKILLPYLSADHPMAVRMKEDHDSIRELILGLDDEPDHRSLKLLADLLDQHIRFEERELFTYLESSLSAEALDKIYGQLEEHAPKGSNFTGEAFWE